MSVKFGFVTVTEHLLEVTLPFIMQYISDVPSDIPFTIPEELTVATAVFVEYQDFEDIVALLGEIDNESVLVASISMVAEVGLTLALFTAAERTVT